MSLKTTRNSKELKSNQSKPSRNQGQAIKSNNVDTKNLKTQSNNNYNTSNNNGVSNTESGLKTAKNTGINTNSNLNNGTSQSNTGVNNSGNFNSGNETINSVIPGNTSPPKPPNNTIKSFSASEYVKYSVNKEAKRDINRYANRRVLTNAKNANSVDEMGVSTLKSTYNTVLKTRNGIKRTVRTAKSIKRLPENYRAVKAYVKTGVNNKINTVKFVAGTTKKIYGNIKTGNFIGALQEVPFDRIKNFGKRKVTKLSVNSVLISKRMALKGAGKFAQGFKNKALNKNDSSADLGSDALFTTLSLLNKSGILATRGGRAAYRQHKKIKTKKKNKELNHSKNGTIKTKKSDTISSRVNKYFDKFKTSKAAKDAIKKAVNKLKEKAKDVFKSIGAIILKNPIILLILAIIIIVILIISLLLNIIVGTHGSCFVSIEPEQTQWISSMNKLDNNTKNSVNSHSRVRTVQSNGTKADWRDVIIAYYMKNNYDASLSGGGTTSLGGGTVSVDPETWEKIYQELQSHLGTDYVYGGSSPETGFDCSGLVQYCYGKFGISLPRVAKDQALCGTHVEYADMMAGDLVFFKKPNAEVHHVGVYIGNNQYIHAPQTGDVVKISDLSTRSDFYEARRVFKVKESSNDNNSPGSSDSSGSSDSTNNSQNDKRLYTALPNNTDLVDIFYRVESETGVDAILLASIAMTESHMDPNAVSGAGASGLCQFMPKTFTDLGFDISMIFDPYTNVLACAHYISELYGYSCITNVQDMLTAYNGGIGNFMKYNGPIPGSSENQEYAGKVLANYSAFSNGQQPNDVQGGSITPNVNTKLYEIYKCFIDFYIDETDDSDNEDKRWILRIYTLEEALDNLGFNEEEKEEFYDFKDYNEDFNEEEQFKDYDVDFTFNVK